MEIWLIKILIIKILKFYKNYLLNYYKILTINTLTYIFDMLI